MSDIARDRVVWWAWQRQNRADDTTRGITEWMTDQEAEQGVEHGKMENRLESTGQGRE